MHDVAQNDIAMVINAMATRSATIQAEKERTENLNRDARNIDGSDFGIGDYSVKSSVLLKSRLQTLQAITMWQIRFNPSAGICSGI